MLEFGVSCVLEGVFCPLFFNTILHCNCKGKKELKLKVCQEGRQKLHVLAGLTIKDLKVEVMPIQNTESSL